MAKPELLLDISNFVGESIIWVEREAALYWVDIVGRHIHRYDPVKHVHASWPTPDLVTSIGACRDGDFVVGLRHKVVRWQPSGDFVELAMPEPHLPNNRLNEGAVAPDGSFWVGTMQDNINVDGGPKAMTSNTGALYRIAANGKVEALTDASFGITNAMVWSSNGGFITADTLKNELYRFRVNGARLEGRELWSGAVDYGLPDGSTMDKDDRVYNARVGGNATAVFSGSGESQRIGLPCSQPTSCIFGGPDLETLCDLGAFRHV